MKLIPHGLLCGTEYAITANSRYGFYKIDVKNLHISAICSRSCIAFENKVSTFFLFLHEKLCCGYALEVPWIGASYKYLQHMFSWRNKKIINTLWLKKSSATQNS